jgi:hypothetical protein
MPTDRTGSARKGAPQRNRHHKLDCAMCGAIVRMSRKALAQMGAPPSCGCGAGPMLVESLEVAAAVLPDHLLADHPDYNAQLAADARKALREHRTSGNRHQCGGCDVFVPAVNHHCRCGFKNDIVGGRNEGRWVEGSARCTEWEREQEIAEGMPF